MVRPTVAVWFCSALVILHVGSAFAQTSPPTSPDGWVTLPVEDYRALRDRALPPPLPPPAPAPAAVITRIDYELGVEGDTASGRVRLTIDVLRDGWTRLPIPSGLMAREARLDGQPVSLMTGKPPHVLLSRAGRSVLTLDIAVPLVTSAGVESIVLPASTAAISRATLVLPKAGVNLTAGDGFVAERIEAAAESRWVVFGRPGQPLTLSWKRRVDDRRAELPLRLRARVTELVALGEDLSQITASIRVEVLQGLARTVTVSIPPGLTVNQVDGSTIGDWTVSEPRSGEPNRDSNGANSTELQVRFLDAIATDVAFTVQADARLPREGLVTIPLMRVAAAERETGGVVLDIAGAGEIGERQPRGLDAADVADLGELVAGREMPSMVAFRFRPMEGSSQRTLAVRVARYTPQAVLIANVEEARYRALTSEDGRQLVEARFLVRNNQRSFLNLMLPDEATLWSASVRGRPVRPGVAGDRGILLPLEKGRAGEEAPTFVVSVFYLQRIDPWEKSGRARLRLPTLDLPISRTGVELYYSPRYRVELQPGAFRREASLPPAASPSLASGPASPSSASAELQSLVDRFRNDAVGRTVAGSLPVPMVFPEFGSVIFLAAELTGESQAPSAELTFKRTAN